MKPPGRLARRARLKPVSDKRRARFEDRAAVRNAVFERDNGVCAAWGIPGVPHSHRDRRLRFDEMEVHELRRGQHRQTDWLNSDWCVPLCHAAHRWATIDGYPEPARTLGLVAGSWETDPAAVAERRRIATKR